MVTISTNQSGALADYGPYVYGQVQKTDNMNTPTTLAFTIVSTGNSVPVLGRGTYIRVNTETYGLWFTGFIVNEPTLNYLGTTDVGSAKLPIYGYAYTATSDEYLLNMNTFGLVNPYLNTTQGAVIRDLVGLLAPAGWTFDLTGVQDGQILPRYVPDPTKKFTQVMADFCQQANYRYYVRDMKIVFEPQDTQPCGIVVDGNSTSFTPKNLQITASTDPIYNDVIVLGQIEPENHMNEYFIGDGYTGKFPLISDIYGTDKTLLLDDDFSGSTISTQNWNVFDTAGLFIIPNNGFLNALGGTGDGLYDCYIKSANLLPLEGMLRLTHGEFDFVADSDGVVGGLWETNPSQDTSHPLAGCLYGLKCTKVNPSAPSPSQDGTILNPIVSGVVDSTQSITINYSWRYVIRTIFSTQNTMRQLPEYSYIDAAGTVQQVGGTSIPDVATFSTIITAIDPTTALMKGQWSWVNSNVSLAANQNFAYYCPLVLNDLHCTVTGVTISTPMQAHLEVKYPGASAFTPLLLGPNEIDSMDGLAPTATIIDNGSASGGNGAGGATTSSSLLAVPSYNSGQAQLVFLSNTALQTTTIPSPKSLVHLSYRRAYSAIARVQDQNSINRESAAWGDDGLRTYVQKKLYLLPRSTEWCELVAQATLNDNVYQHYTGSYTMYSGPWFTSEPMSGTILKFQNLPSTITAVLQAEEVNQVVTTLLHSNNQEYFQHVLNYGPVVSANQVLSQIQSVTGVFTPSDSVVMPYAIDVTSVGKTFVGDVVAPTLTSWDTNNFYFSINQNPPAGGGFEVRYTDASWGVDTGKNFIIRTTGQTFSVPRNSQGKVCFVKAYDTRNNLLWSEDMTQAAWKGSSTPPTATSSLLKNRLNEMSMISTVTLGHSNTTQLEQYVAVVPSASTLASFTVDLLANAGGQVVVQIVDNSGNIYGTQTVEVTKYWQRISVSGTGSGHSSFGTSLGVRLYNPATTDLVVQVNRASLEIGVSSETVYAKTAAVVFGAMSRFAAGLHVAFPLIPVAPTAYITYTDPTQITINVVLPSAVSDVWGTEIRASDQTTVLYSDMLIDSAYNPSFVVQNTGRSLSYWVYTFNLLGEYSPGYHLTMALPTPSVTGVAVDDAAKMLNWTNGSANQGVVIQATFDNTVASASYPTLGTVTTINTSISYNNSDGSATTVSSISLPDGDFFPTRTFTITPYDVLGSGTPASVTHTYNVNPLVDFSSAECGAVDASTTSTSPPSYPAVVAPYRTAYITVANANAIANRNINY